VPLVRISLRQGKSSAYKKQIADAVHQAMVDTIGIPSADRFQIITEHAPDMLLYDPHYLGIERTGDIVMVQIALSAGRTVEQKRALYQRMTALLEQSPGIRPADILVSLVEVGKDADTSKANWSFGLGVAQYLG
jgi:4-oxalocrotonate tautomerase